MKKIIFILVASLILIGGWIAYNAYTLFASRREPTKLSVALPPTDTVTPKPTKTITIGTVRYAYDYIGANDPSTITLIPNYSQKLDVKSLMEANTCVSAVNGGFYDKNSKPLGYMQSAGKTLGPKIESDLVNGFVWDASGAAVISAELPRLSFTFAMQTGPLLLFDGQVQPLTIHNDAEARRMIAAKTTNNALIFLTIYNEDSVYLGPKLGDLPEIVQAISGKENLGIADAINLDGGSASAFYSGTTSLSELTPVGSLFCVK